MRRSSLSFLPKTQESFCPEFTGLRQWIAHFHMCHADIVSYSCHSKGSPVLKLQFWRRVPFKHVFLPITLLLFSPSFLRAKRLFLWKTTAGKWKCCKVGQDRWPAMLRDVFLQRSEFKSDALSQTKHGLYCWATNGNFKYCKIGSIRGLHLETFEVKFKCNMHCCWMPTYHIYDSYE